MNETANRFNLKGEIRRINPLLLSILLLIGISSQVVAVGPDSTYSTSSSELVCIFLGNCGQGEGQGAAQGTSPINADNASVSHGMVVLLDDPPGPPPPDGLPTMVVGPVTNGASTMLRNRHGVTVSVNTSGLEPDAAHTIWFLVFNNPQFCVGDEVLACNPGVGDLQNPDVEGSVFWGGGRVTDAHGQLAIESTIFAGGETPGQHLFGPGLINSQTADIHVIVRSHGPAEALEAAGELEAALTTVAGGCGVNACADVQAVAHQP